MISKKFDMGDSRYSVMKWVWPICSHAHILEDGDMSIQPNCDII